MNSEVCFHARGLPRTSDETATLDVPSSRERGALGVAPHGLPPELPLPESKSDFATRLSVRLQREPWSVLNKAMQEREGSE